jgi:polysaccharide export outer membrane protein
MPTRLALRVMAGRWIWLVLHLFAVMSGAGCRSIVEYTARDLPPEIRSLSDRGPKNVDLSRIARQSISANVIYPGDVLDVTIASGAETTPPQPVPIRVDDQGNVELPLVGSVTVGGLSLTDAEGAIQQAGIEKRIYRRPQVTVLMRERRTIQVRVIGAVTKPGIYELPAAGSDLLAAIVAAGGLTDEAGTQVEVRHPNGLQAAKTAQSSGVMLASFEDGERPQRTVRIDLQETGRRSPAELEVEDGSVVMVMPKTMKSISVIGLVRRPGNYELPKDEPLRVLDALALAGDRTLSIANKIHVIRQVPDRDQPVVIGVSIRKAKASSAENLVLAPGDVISVEETPVTFIVDTIRGFIRFGFSSAIPGV